MNKRIVEMLAAVIGVALVAVLYLHNGPAESSRPENPAGAETVHQPLSDSHGAVRSRSSAATLPAVAVQRPGSGDAVVPSGDSAPHGSARADLEAARIEQQQVRAELAALDVTFDARGAHFAAREAQGADPDVLSEEMLIFLDEIVERYDELETRLAEAESLEREAAERLTALAGTRQRPGGSS